MLRNARGRSHVKLAAFYSDAAVGERLRILRRAHGWSQIVACERTGIPTPSWNSYEMGKKRLSLESAIDVIAAVPGVDLDWLYLGIDKHLAPPLREKLRKHCKLDGAALPPALTRSALKT